MSNQPSPDKRQVGLRIDLDVCKRVEKKYSQPDDVTRSVAYIRALEDATREVQLTAEDYEEILAEARRNAAASRRKRRASK